LVLMVLTVPTALTQLSLVQLVLTAQMVTVLTQWQFQTVLLEVKPSG
jgi:hypothetical protein